VRRYDGSQVRDMRRTTVAGTVATVAQAAGAQAAGAQAAGAQAAE
jgi:hypothetical protein